MSLEEKANSQPLLRQATEEDALFIAHRLREADVAEIYAASRASPLEALLRGINTSVPHAWVLDSPTTGKPFVIGGITPLGGQAGLVWLLATPEIEQHALTFQREAWRHLQAVWKSGEFTAIGNIIHTKNDKAITWLQRLGFTIVYRDQPVGVSGELFHVFTMTRPVEAN